MTRNDQWADVLLATYVVASVKRSTLLSWGCRVDPLHFIFLAPWPSAHLATTVTTDWGFALRGNHVFKLPNNGAYSKPCRKHSNGKWTKTVSESATNLRQRKSKNEYWFHFFTLRHNLFLPCLERFCTTSISRFSRSSIGRVKDVWCKNTPPHGQKSINIIYRDIYLTFLHVTLFTLLEPLPKSYHYHMK